jgi:hypothetical protein
MNSPRFLALVLLSVWSASALAREPGSLRGRRGATEAADLRTTETSPSAMVAEPPSADTAESDAVVAPALPELSRELGQVEEEVNSLKDQVFRSKATLRLLKELVVDSSISGSRLVLWHQNRLPGVYSVESVQYVLDGRPVYSRADVGPDGLSDAAELKVVDQALPAGPHTLQVNLVLRGNGAKLFSYLSEYQFNVSSTYSFTVEKGRITVLRVAAESRGGLRSFVERPTVRYDEHFETSSEE